MFPGQYYDGETGLYYNYFRDYDPTLGRYVESDPIGLMGGNNTYYYTNANPIKYIDCFGLATSCISYVQCSSALFIALVFCTQTTICIDDCGIDTVDIKYDWYVWPDRDFSFYRDYDPASSFPGSAPSSSTIFPSPTYSGNPNII